MSSGNRKHEQADLLFKLGAFLGPMLDMAENPTLYDADERIRIVARLSAEHPGMVVAAERFCRGEPGHFYQFHYNLFCGQVYALVNSQRFEGSPEQCETIKKTIAKVQDILMSIPVPIDSIICEAQTPFSTYCLIRDLCSTAKTQIVWLDRYFDQTVFYRYFYDVLPAVNVTLVTLPDTSSKSASDKNRHSDFMNMSRLFAQERGPSGYRLITNTDFHDRWLRCDDKLFTLGGSIKDLSKPFTIARLDSTTENAKHFDDAISNGVEVFGPNQAAHP